jgi:hypothetical protein
LLSAAPASAHTHFLTLPSDANPTQYIAAGVGGHVEGADWHPLHCLVHIGTPGMQAFDIAYNPVDIFRDGTFTGTCAAKPGNLP